MGAGQVAPARAHSMNHARTRRAIAAASPRRCCAAAAIPPTSPIATAATCESVSGRLE